MPTRSLDVPHVLALARLKVTQTEQAQLQQDLLNILDHLDVLQSADLSGVDALVHAGLVEQPLREDTVQQGTGGRGLEGSAGVQDTFVKVPTVVE